MIVALVFALAAAPQSRPVEAFSGIASGGSFTVEVKGGTAPALAIDAEDPAEADLITTRVDKSTLYIECRHPCAIKKNLTVYVTATSLDNVSHGGSGAMTIADVKSKQLKLNFGGSGSLDWRGSADDLFLSQGGSGKATLAGKSKKLEVALGGSGEADASALEVRDVKVTLGGSGRALVNATGDLDAVVAGSGRVTYLGNPRVKKTITGSGRVEAKEAPRKASSGW